MISSKIRATDMHKVHRGVEYDNVTIYDRSLLCVGNKLAGPCIVTEEDSNTLITPSHHAEVDIEGNLLIWSEVRMSGGVDPKDPIIVQLAEAGLQNARLEMDALIQRVAMSPAMREQLDYFPMLSAGKGKNAGKMVCLHFISGHGCILI